MSFSDGTSVVTTWLYGRKHGKALISNSTKNYSAVYYHDMENLLDRSTNKCWDCSCLNMVLVCIFIGSILPAIYKEPKIFILTAIAYVAMLCESCCSDTKNILSNIKSAKEVQIYLDSLSNQSPKINFWIQNYHYEQRTRGKRTE